MAEAAVTEIKPRTLHRLYDILRDAGVDVRDWAKGKGGKKRASRNPRYCFEWSFSQPSKFIVLNLWYGELQETNGTIWRGLNLRQQALREQANPIRRRRALNMDQHIQSAYIDQLPVRVIFLDGSPSRVTKRALDPKPWGIVEYDWATGECTLKRGASSEPPTGYDEQEDFDGFEGESLRRYVLHRRRERWLRDRKLEQARRLNNGRLICEVPGCGFDFVARYGRLGEGFAHVHHLAPLSAAPLQGRKVSLNDLAVVCANCHAMIHRGGESRPLDKLVSGQARNLPHAS